MYLVKYIGNSDAFWKYRPFNSLEDAQLFIAKCVKEGMVCGLYREVIEE